MKLTRILIVDDHGPFRQTLTDFLRRQPGVEVVGEAEDGEQAVTQARALRPDLILMDFHLPKMNGDVAARAIKDDDPTVRAVILSGSPGEPYRRAAVECHADGYIEKIFMKTALQQLLAAPHHAQVVSL